MLDTRAIVVATIILLCVIGMIMMGISVYNKYLDFQKFKEHNKQLIYGHNKNLQ